MAGAEVAAVFDIVVLGEWRDEGGTACDLADAVEDDLSAAVVEFYRTMDFDGAACEAADVADIFQVVGEDDDREGTSHLIFAEVEKVDAPRADLYPKDFTGYALVLADVLAGFVNRNTVGSEECGCYE